jgi:hypothetical protein
MMTTTRVQIDNWLVFDSQRHLHLHICSATWFYNSAGICNMYIDHIYIRGIDSIIALVLGTRLAVLDVDFDYFTSNEVQILGGM